ncbi:polyprenyl synthetase family protein [Limosilactobacillus gastricus]|uniref:polyprenyl synthetase family protein n=1 Tax=Limosilactobacillus gastricus TaxID=227942 RepID=UPI0026F154D0|nr:polyprenyl synthetase family protein [Limosilactobacillus gastricus]
MSRSFIPQYPELNTNLQAVADLITNRIQTADHQLETALKTMANNGGKYIRPGSVCLFSMIKGPNDQEQLLKAAASIEILHMATLIHDDIIDDAPQRRGAISIQAAFGKDIAVYSGDYLFTVFFQLITEAFANTPLLKVNATVMSKILNGELGQMAHRFDLNQSVTTYLDNIKGKTAALFSLAAREGAFLGNLSEQEVQIAQVIGEKVGMAFQILDDILDYSDGHDMNKPVLEDLTTGVYSLPLLIALANDPSHAIRDLLAKQSQMTMDDLLQIRQLVIANDGVKIAHQTAQQYSNDALASLADLPDSKATRNLKKLINKLLNRTN